MSSVFSGFANESAIQQLYAQNGDGSTTDATQVDLASAFIQNQNKKRLKQWLRNIDCPVTSVSRKDLWVKLLMESFSDESDLYEETLLEMYPGGLADRSITLPAFVDSRHMNGYHLTTEGVQHIHCILSMLGHLCPDVTFCPCVFVVTSVLGHYLSPRQCFSWIYNMLRVRSSGYQAKQTSHFLWQTRLGYEASSLVLNDLLKKHARTAYSFLKNQSKGQVDEVVQGWVWLIFEDLPFPYLVRIMDCYLLEGNKVFYRVALYILKSFTKFSAKNGTKGENIVNNLRQFVREIPITIDVLLKKAFQIRGLSHKQIRKLQLKNEMFLTSKNRISEMKILDVNAPDGVKTSRSFSGPIVLQAVNSDILNPDMLLLIWSWLPARMSLCQPTLLYTSQDHGVSITTVFNKIQGQGPTLLIIKATNHEIFGAYCSTDWEECDKHLKYVGTGETFVFTLSPEIKKYDWVGRKMENVQIQESLFQAADRMTLIIGGGNGEALRLNDDLSQCRTTKCQTFDNAPLCHIQDFSCLILEIYGFL